MVRRTIRAYVDHHAMAFNPLDPNLINGNDGGINISTNGGQTFPNQNIPATQFYEIGLI
jgi:hypothetical protein